MKLPSIAIVWTTGIAIFAMFFGSGNVVFPLILGQMTGDHVGWALLGLTVTAVGAPLLGLLAAVLFEADCKQFFYRIGEFPGYLMVLLILALLGPIGVMPRCFVVAYGAIKQYFPDLSLLLYSQIAGVVTLILIARRNYILPLLGFWLSPLKIMTLLAIIVIAWLKMEPLREVNITATDAMMQGLAVGYNTMDLLASIIFAVSIWMLLKERLNLTQEKEVKTQLVPTYVLASIIGGSLLGIIYVGLSFSAAAHHAALIDSPPEQVLARLAIYLLGPKLALVANFAIVISCLTTVMSLAVAVVDVIHVEIMNTRIGRKIPFSYGWMMLSVIIVTVIFSNLGFRAIMDFLAPILALCYPSIIVLTVCNILYKLYGFPYVKLPFYLTLVGMIIWEYFSVGGLF